MSFLSMLFASPPAPVFTSSCLIDLSSKIYIITDTSLPSNISLARTLYNLHATIYIGLSSYDTIDILKASCPNSKGHLKPFVYDPSDLASVKSAVDNFLENEWRLDVLFVNCSNEFLPCFVLVKLLMPILQTSASHFCHPNSSIRVIWISEEDSAQASCDQLYFLAQEFSRRKQCPKLNDSYAHTLPNSNPSGVQHVLEDQRRQGADLRRSFGRFLPFGAQRTEYDVCTLLYAGLAPRVASGDWVIPWGRKGEVSEFVRACTARQNDETNGVAAALFEHYEERTRVSM
ncbi:hypothetical protein HBH69_209180 [Parastagonospora nodorum]|nr:hypothetical protein HBH52_173960 [Parastagonospora nodorum]KAH4181416.1 hypothetical protein HBH42_238290 [Parastagonospora nodorum]KAH5005044.1 hypothetical protein HBI75_230210 [Parastagonospora nodorum]KAH5140403.1 hypothetical protein HBH69_209180 [Parastagonospora nodorum]KAH6038345.1 hypothetical protein HBI54_174340 [Parastagonospora nodorum]